MEASCELPTIAGIIAGYRCSHNGSYFTMPERITHELWLHQFAQIKKN